MPNESQCARAIHVCENWIVALSETDNIYVLFVRCL